MEPTVKKQTIDRRTFLRKFSQAVGYTAAATIIAGSNLSTALAYTPKPDSALRDGVLFNKSQMQTLLAIGNTILPRTDTPSAADLDCHGFVDNQLATCHSKQEQTQVAQILAIIEKQAKAKHGNSFNNITEDKRIELLTAIEQDNSDQQRDKFKLLKSLIIFGYFTSEVGATQVLSYQAVPGGYKGSVKVNEDTKAWGSLDFY